ncbi:hypothetical protein G6F70_009331 [Rhizopus microsporus]|nr:hypothetical protein G6F71_009343 [Rhizopus microsporus]KAG1191212.1 hypothetical protein G6F70_009331 [Rhizopus microsporus]KAG1205689.1 hypothetical protein G6F69_009310 [Rhizopus microsporus]KAG1225275.1 hypothetical protein G6F67_009342 [Rhizopus microsporus]KAG1255077.1 hypothetical protein G6F68_010552 [Rhizopus microsporus]
MADEDAKDDPDVCMKEASNIPPALLFSKINFYIFKSIHQALPVTTLAPGDRILTVKSSVDGIDWNNLHRETLESFVERVHTTTMHAYSLSKFIFLRELDRARAQLIIEYRELINRHLNGYLAIINYQRPNFVFAQQSAIIEGTKIYTVYANNVHLRFGQHLRRAVNALLNTR